MSPSSVKSSYEAHSTCHTQAAFTNRNMIKPLGNIDGPANKVHLTSTEDIQDETFISVWKLHILETRQKFRLLPNTIEIHNEKMQM